MRLVSRALAPSGLLAGAVLALLSPSGWTQDAPVAGEKVKFESTDGVELHGTFYAAAKKNAPAVLVVHAIGDSSRRKEYTELAGALQKAGYSTLTFDLRGHGQSTSVDAKEFWSNKYLNARNVKGAPKETIEFADISKGYYSVFVNDIAAAKAFLDKRNDANECNSSSLTLIGANSGATLAAIWLNSEWYRHKLIPPANGFGQAQPDLKNPEGKNIVCGFWLSITPELGTRKVALSSLLALAAQQKKVPMIFVYNQGNSADKSTALNLDKYIKGKDKKNYPLTDTFPVDAGGMKLTGRELLKRIKTSEIVGYLQRVTEDKGNEWQEQEPRKTQSIWKIGNTVLPARVLPVDTAIKFSLYYQFIR